MASLESYCSFLYLLIVQLTIVTAINAQLNLFQCHPSSDNELVYTPNISDCYFNAMETARLRESHNLTDTDNFHTYIFTIPSDSHNCSGTVRSIEYCYRLRKKYTALGQTYEVFNFLMLSRNGTRFEVINRVNIQTTPQNNSCMEDNTFEDISHICCDQTVLDDSDQFDVPSSAYAYGVEIINNNVRPFLLRRSHQIGQYISTDMDSQEFNATESSSNQVLLLRFFTALNGSSNSSNGEQPNSNNGGDSNGEKSDTHSNNRGSENSTRRESDNRNLNRGSNKRNSRGNKGSNSNIIATIVGGAIGGSVALAMLITTITLCVVAVAVVQCRTKKYCKTCENSGARFENVMYQEVTEIESLIPPAKYDGNRALICNNTHEYEVLIEEEDQDLYVIPAQTEDALYDQLRDDLNIQYIVQNSVRLGDELGSGQFGVVYKGVLQSRGGGGGEVDVAVKTLKEGSGEEDRVKFLQEAAIMGQFKHHNVVTMYGVVAEIEQVLLVLELLAKGDLRSHLLHMRSDEDGEVSVDDHTLLSYCRQVASGMAYLSSKAFVHRDLAARNILVSEDGICKIADFGMSRDLMDESYYVSHGGTIPVKWTAPEALHYKKYSTASDVWSYGALMYEIWSVGHKPYEEHENKEVIRLIDSGFCLPPPPGCPRALYTIMISCWHPVSSDRPTFLDITQQLSMPDPRLLKWSEEDKSVHPESAKLGADLLCAQDLYKDLQMKYHAK